MRSDPYLSILHYPGGKNRYLVAASSIPRQRWSGMQLKKHGSSGGYNYLIKEFNYLIFNISRFTVR